jgi:hypothetical protein
MAKKWNIADLPKPIQELIVAAREYNKARRARRTFEQANPCWWQEPYLKAEHMELNGPVKDGRERVESAAKKVH